MISEIAVPEVADAYIVLAPDGTTIGESDSQRVVPFWSFGKTLIAATALRMVEQERLSLDEPVDARGFTLRQLLAHRAGLPDYFGLETYRTMVESAAPSWSPERYFAETGAERLRAGLGQSFAYSNIGYLIVRQMIEKATGCDLGAAISELVFEPLRLSSIRLARDPADLVGVDMGTRESYHPGYVAHGLFVGRVCDAARALAGILGGSVLAEPSRRMMVDREPIGSGPLPGRPWLEPAYGLGMMAGSIRAGFAIGGHTGGGPGSRIAVYHRLDNGRTAVAFIGSDAVGDGAVEEAAVALLEGGAV